MIKESEPGAGSLTVVVSVLTEAKERVIIEGLNAGLEAARKRDVVVRRAAIVSVGVEIKFGKLSTVSKGLD